MTSILFAVDELLNSDESNNTNQTNQTIGQVYNTNELRLLTVKTNMLGHSFGCHLFDIGFKAIEHSTFDVSVNYHV